MRITSLTVGAFVTAAMCILAGRARAAGAGGNGAAASRTFVPNPRLAAMAENSWLKLTPKREALSRAYSGNCFGGGELWYFGGAHHSYAGNDVELYSPAKNEWRRSEIEWPDAENLKRFGQVKATTTPVTPKGRPWASHTYQQVCYVPQRKMFFMVSRGHTWEFDPAELKWKCLAGVASEGKKPSPQYQGAQSFHVVYDPGLNAPVGIATTGPFGTFVYDYAKMEWKRRKDAPMKWAELYSTYIASKKVHLVSAGTKHGMWTYDAVKDEWKKAEDAPKEVIGTQALAYDPTQDVVLSARGSKGKPVSLWVLDVKTMKWSEQKPANAEKGPKSIAKWCPLWYDPGHNVFLYLSYDGRGPVAKGGPTSIWAYRYKAAAGK